MLVELRDVEVYVEPDDILSKALREGDLSISEAICICEEEAGTDEILKSIDDEDIQRYCESRELEIECSFEMMVKNLRTLSQEQRASLLWFIIGINDEDIKKLVTVELLIPKMNELIQVKKNNEHS